jgi:hypothetical protein
MQKICSPQKITTIYENSDKNLQLPLTALAIMPVIGQLDWELGYHLFEEL